MTVEHIRGTTNEATDELSRMFDVDFDPNDWKKFIEETIQARIQLNAICYQKLYKEQYKLVKEQPDGFCDWKIEYDELFYYRPDYEKALIDDEHHGKKVVKTDDILTILRENHDTLQSDHLGKDKTLDGIRQNYYWPGMALEVKSYIEDCEICIEIK